jgi:hypothetical protein
VHDASGEGRSESAPHSSLAAWHRSLVPNDGYEGYEVVRT